MNHLPVILLSVVVLLAVVGSILQIKRLLQRPKDLPNYHPSRRS